MFAMSLLSSSTTPPPEDASEAESSKSLLLRLVRLPHAAGLGLAVFLLGFGLSISGPFMALFAVKEAHLTPLQLGIFLTLNAVSAVLVSTLLARWSDKLPNRKPVVLLTLAAGAIAFALLSVLRSYPALLLTGVVFMGSSAASFPQLFAFARAQFSDAPAELQGRALTVLRTMFSLAFVVGPGLGAVLLAHFRFHGTFLFTAMCFVLAALPLIKIPGRKPQATREAQATAVGVPATRSAIAWVSVAFVLYGLSMSMGFTMFPLFITDTIGGTEGQVGFLVGLCALLEIPAMLALVTLKRLPTTERLIKAALLLFAIHFALVYFSNGMPLLIATQAIRAAVLAVTAGLGMVYFQELMPGRFAAATTLYSNTSSIGGMIAGIVSGACAQWFGYRAVFLLCAALTFFGWVVMQTMVGRKLGGKGRQTV